MFAKPCARLLLLAALALMAAPVLSQTGAVIPHTETTALDGRHVTLPAALPASATVLILGFGRSSQAATTDWEKPIRTQLAQGDAINFYDMAMLAEIPGLLRPLVLRTIRGKVPDVLKSRFLPLTDGEDAWKRASSYDPTQPDAAYVLLVDRSGKIHWTTHDAFSPRGFAELTRRAQQLASTAR